MSPVFRYLLIALFSVTMIWLGFKRERNLIIVNENSLQFINRYQEFPKTDYKSEMKNFSAFHLSYKLQSSLLFSLFFTVLAVAILYLFSSSTLIAKLTLLLYLAYFVLCFIFIQLGNFGFDYRLSYGLSHYLEDLFLSPFFVMALIVLLKAFGVTYKSSEKKTV